MRVVRRSRFSVLRSFRFGSGVGVRRARFQVLSSDVPVLLRGSRFTVRGSRFKVRSLGFAVHRSRFIVHASRFRVHGSRFRVLGSGSGFSVLVPRSQFWFRVPSSGSAFPGSCSPVRVRQRSATGRTNPEPRTPNPEQSTENLEPRTANREPRTANRERRTSNREPNLNTNRARRTAKLERHGSYEILRETSARRPLSGAAFRFVAGA